MLLWQLFSHTSPRLGTLSNLTPTGPDGFLEYHKENWNDHFRCYQSGRHARIPAELKGKAVWACHSWKCKRLLQIEERSFNSFHSAVSVFQPFFLSAPADMHLLIPKLKSLLRCPSASGALRSSPSECHAIFRITKKKIKIFFPGICIDWVKFTTLTFGLD